MHLSGTPLAPTLADLTELQYVFLVAAMSYRGAQRAEAAEAAAAAERASARSRPRGSIGSSTHHRQVAELRQRLQTRHQARR